MSQNSKKDRGQTFIGFAPKIEETKKQRAKSRKQKHKKDLTKEEEYDIIRP